MDTAHDYLKARFAFVRQDLDEVLRRLSDSDLGWSPRKGMPTIADLLLEIANKEKETIVWLQVGEWPDGDPDAFEIESTTLDGIKATMASLRTATFSNIDSLSEDQLNELIPNPNLWWEALRVPACPRSEVLRNIAMHEWYHTAQLITYQWMRGYNPNE